MARADKYSLTQKKIEIYSDFTINFDRNPYTGDLARATNEESVKQSLKALFLTKEGEIFYSDRGSVLAQSLFDLAEDPAQEDATRLLILETAGNYEPRADIKDIQVDWDNNSMFVKIVFSILNIPDQEFLLNLSVDRIR